MKKILDVISEALEEAFEQAGYERKYGKAALSNRPDLCEFQCNGALAAAKAFHKAPMQIAEDVAAVLTGADTPVFEEIQAVKPGFLNMKLSKAFLSDYLDRMASEFKFGLSETTTPLSIIVDYGGPNVAKPLHVGHLRSAIIGESIKRICRYMGNHVIGDIHLGDWGLQMGLIITELSHRQPELVYFDESFTGDYPKEAPFTISELEEIYPTASARQKEDEAYREEALKATFDLQNGRRGYHALWEHIMQISVEDLKKNYRNLNVYFDWWKGESDVQKYIPDMVAEMKKDGFAYESDGALVVDVSEESDQKEVPPCMILKSDGAALYTTTDLATLKERRSLADPDHIIYVVDKRQEMHFLQVFRCAKKTGILKEDVKLDFLGFGTMNGKDGKPFKTREGGVMRLETLLSDINEEMYKKISDNHAVDEEEGRETAKLVALAAVKYGDLSNQATKDYVFDIDKFTSFEGNTGPYILYTIVRIKSVLSRFSEEGGSFAGLEINEAGDPTEKELELALTKFISVIETAYEELAPHKICAYIYEVANAFNRFYHENKILTEEDEKKKRGYIGLIKLTKELLEECIALLGFDAPERM
ncbi:MAG: arginine--tRNA ligase [Lachnospiraceae bacterium]|nr:arginine--tRNA ligase [Lachnospiraceae bacterium]